MMCRHRSTTERPHRSAPVKRSSRTAVATGSGGPPLSDEEFAEEAFDYFMEEDDDALEETLLNGFADMSRLTLEAIWARMDRFERRLFAEIRSVKERENE